MKTNEELKELKQECEVMNSKLRELSDDELNLVTGGINNTSFGFLPGVIFPFITGGPMMSAHDEVSVRVRGGGSITQSNEPLYIVDGFPVESISDIPSSDIESIEILKDASAGIIK